MERSTYTPIELKNYDRPDFDRKIGPRPLILDLVRQLVDRKTQGLIDPGERAVARYEVEYANGQELAAMLESTDLQKPEVDVEAVLNKRCNYTYWTPLMNPDVFKTLTNIDPDEMRKLDSIVDVGAGSGDLIRTLIKWGVNPQRVLGVDISSTSSQRITELGCQSRCGRFDEVVSSNDSFDLIFLSYFIDRDANQTNTFLRTLQSLKISGTLVLEGLFPCIPIDPNGLVYSNPENTITRGNSTQEDIALVISAFKEISTSLDMNIEIIGTGSGEREVYSRDDKETLPSDIIVVKRTR